MSILLVGIFQMEQFEKAVTNRI